jgi:glycosyltransferase involved in cell wall biosynthesis
LVTISDNIANEHIKRGVPENKVLVLEDGVDMDQFDINDDKVFWRNKYDLPLHKKIIMYAGHLYEEKGIEHILIVAKKLKKNDEFIFILVGGWKKDIMKWERYCEREKLSNVRFFGFVENSILPGLLKAADVLFMPYKTQMDFKVMDIDTTSPMKLFEFMASKRPIISTKIPTISKVVTHEYSAMLATPNDIVELASFVLTLGNDTDLALQIGRNAFNEVGKYDWKVRCNKIISKVFNK